MKHLFLVLIFLFSFSPLVAQLKSNEIKLEGKTYPLPNLEDLITWAGIYTTQWEGIIKRYYQFDRSVSEMGGIAFSSSGKDFTYVIEKRPGNELQVVYSYFDGNNLFDDTINLLEPYFVKSHNSMNEYSISNSEIAVRFLVMRTNSMVIINVKIFK